VTVKGNGQGRRSRVMAKGDGQGWRSRVTVKVLIALNNRLPILMSRHTTDYQYSCHMRDYLYSCHMTDYLHSCHTRDYLFSRHMRYCLYSCHVSDHLYSSWTHVKNNRPQFLDGDRRDGVGFGERNWWQIRFPLHNLGYWKGIHFRRPNEIRKLADTSLWGPLGGGEIRRLKKKGWQADSDCEFLEIDYF